MAKSKNERSELNIPESLTNALKENKAASEAFESLPPSHKKEYINWIEEAKKEETKQNRIAKTIEMLSVGKKL